MKGMQEPTHLEKNESPPANEEPELETMEGEEEPPVAENVGDAGTNPTGKENEGLPTNDKPEPETMEGEEEPPVPENEGDIGTNPPGKKHRPACK